MTECATWAKPVTEWKDGLDTVKKLQIISRQSADLIFSIILLQKNFKPIKVKVNNIKQKPVYPHLLLV